MSIGKYWFVLPILVLPVIVMSLFDSFKTNDMSDQINKTPLSHADSGSLHCNSGATVKVELYADDAGVQAQNGDAYAYQAISKFVKSGNSHSSPSWVQFEHEPENFLLFDKEHKIAVHVDVSNMDEQFLPTVFDGDGSQRNSASMPKSWVAMMVDGVHYRVTGLTGHKKLLVIGSFWQTKSGIYLRGIEYKGFGATKYYNPAIVKPQP